MVSLTGLILAFAGHTEPWELWVPVGVGGIFLVLSFLTDGKMGMGDAWILIAMGTMLDLQIYLTALLLGLFAASAWSGYLMVVKKKCRTTEIPFLPFLLFGYLGGLCLCM